MTASRSLSSVRLAPVVCAADFQPGADARADVVEPVGHHPREVRLASAERLGHALQSPVQLGPGSREFAHALFKFALALLGGRALAHAKTARARKADHEKQ